MSWINSHKIAWRIIAIVFLVVGQNGPWFFGRFAGPTPHGCTAPWVRLSDMMCGMPISPVSFVIEHIQYAPGITTPFLSILLLLPFILPIMSTGIMILVKDFKPWKKIHLVVLILVAAYGIYFFAATETSVRSALWGIWLSLITLLLLLILETFTLRLRGRPDRAAQVNA